MTHGPIPANMCICHCCDNPKCVNPLHLFLATQKQNIEDMMQKNRGNKAKGEDHGKAKLSNQTVAEIKAALDRDRYHGQIKDLAAKHNVSEAHMSNIANGKRRAS